MPARSALAGIYVARDRQVQALCLVLEAEGMPGVLGVPVLSFVSRGRAESKEEGQGSGDADGRPCTSGSQKGREQCGAAGAAADALAEVLGAWASDERRYTWLRSVRTELMQCGSAHATHGRVADK